MNLTKSKTFHKTKKRGQKKRQDTWRGDKIWSLEWLTKLYFAKMKLIIMQVPEAMSGWVIVLIVVLVLLVVVSGGAKQAHNNNKQRTNSLETPLSNRFSNSSQWVLSKKLVGCLTAICKQFWFSVYYHRFAQNDRLLHVKNIPIVLNLLYRVNYFTGTP